MNKRLNRNPLQYYPALLAILVLSLITTACKINNKQSSLERESHTDSPLTMNASEIQLDALVRQYSEDIYQFYPIMATFRGKNEFNDKFSPEINNINAELELKTEKNIYRPSNQ